MMMASAQALAAMSPTARDKDGALLPPLAELRAVSMGVALAVGRQAAAEGLAGVKGEAFEEALRANVWAPRYLPYKRRR
jgi:malate dehydrogenase (oxaloacetate-decarboxylating)